MGLRWKAMGGLARPGSPLARKTGGLPRWNRGGAGVVRVGLREGAHRGEAGLSRRTLALAGVSGTGCSLAPRASATCSRSPDRPGPRPSGLGEEPARVGGRPALIGRLNDPTGWSDDGQRRPQGADPPRLRVRRLGVPRGAGQGDHPLEGVVGGAEGPSTPIKDEDLRKVSTRSGRRRRRWRRGRPGRDDTIMASDPTSSPAAATCPSSSVPSA